MNILGFNITRSRPNARPSHPTTARRFYTPDEWLRGEDLDAGGETLSNAYQQVVWVYRAINVLAEQVANVPFLFSAGDRGLETLITTVPLPEFYDQPVPIIHRVQYWELRVI